MDGDATMRKALRLTGEIEVGWREARARLTRMEYLHEGADVRLVLAGPLGELRALSLVSPAFAAMLDLVAQEEGTREGTLRLRASSALAKELEQAEARMDALPDAWLQDAAWTGLAFALDRYEPESVGVVAQVGQ